MAKRRHSPEQVIGKLREAEVAIAEGRTVAEALLPADPVPVPVGLT